MPCVVVVGLVPLGAVLCVVASDPSEDSVSLRYASNWTRAYWYCFTVMTVSWVVLFTSVSMASMKKRIALNSASPFLTRDFCVLALLVKASCKSGCLKDSSEKSSANDFCVWITLNMCAFNDLAKVRILLYFACVSRRISIFFSNSGSTVFVVLPNFSLIT